jgi:Ca-activated chloride channel family protein
VRSPLTSDLPALARLVDGVDEERGLLVAGSDLGAAIRAALRVVERGEAETRALLVVSDGEDHGTGVAGAIADARRAGVRVYTAGAGTAAGSPVLDVNPVTGALQPRRDASGQSVVTRLDAGALRQMAEEGGGRYIELSGDGRPLASLAPELAGLATTVFASRQAPERIERFQAFAAGAFALVVVVSAASLAGALLGRRAARLWPVAAAGLFVAALCSDGIDELNRRGNRQYAQGDYAAALESYRDAQAMDPGVRPLYYNAGNALHQEGQFDAAVEESRRALPADAELTDAAEYAIGNHHLRAGRLIEAIEAYKRALLADPSDADAKHNLEVARLLQTPSPTPTRELPTPELSATPGPGEDEPGAQDGQTPQPDAGGQQPGTPQAGEPTGEPQLSPEQLQRRLEEALRGIDEEFTTEEALRVLDLLEEQNRSQLSEPQGSQPGLPDY